MRGFFRWLLLAVAVLSVLLGIWWVLQGTGLAPIGFMANHMQWAYRGAGLIVFGLIVGFLGRRL